MMTVKVTADSDVRKLPPEAAARFAARARGGAAAGQARAGQRAACGAGKCLRATRMAGQQRRSAGMDLSQMLSRLPTETISDLKVGDAVMVVASQAEPGSSDVRR